MKFTVLPFAAGGRQLFFISLKNLTWNIFTDLYSPTNLRPFHDFPSIPIISLHTHGYVARVLIITAADGFPGQKVSHFSSPPSPPPTERMIRHTHVFRDTAVDIANKIYRFRNDKVIIGWTSALLLYGKTTYYEPVKLVYVYLTFLLTN